MERDQLKSVIESLLFVAESSLTVRNIGDVIEGVERKEILSVISELQSEYETAGRGFRLVEVAGGYQLRTPKENADWVKRFHQSRPARMTRATLETLAIIAYKQPITRAEIETIRGVDVDGVLSTLQEKHLVRIVARKDGPGRPFLYSTTSEFLELFNLKDLTNLPTLKEMEEMTVPELPEKEAPPAESEE